jgi:hypothetical protein
MVKKRVVKKQQYRGIHFFRRGTFGVYILERLRRVVPLLRPGSRVKIRQRVHKLSVVAGPSPRLKLEDEERITGELLAKAAHLRELFEREPRVGAQRRTRG